MILGLVNLAAILADRSASSSTASSVPMRERFRLTPFPSEDLGSESSFASTTTPVNAGVAVSASTTTPVNVGVAVTGDGGGTFS